MKVFTNRAHDNKYMVLEKYYDKNITIAFDIETTGFAARTSILYLVGCAYYDSGNWNIIQWFNNDGISELEILIAFFDFIKKYKYLVNYNGDGFDIPFLISKLEKLSLEYSFADIESIDLYKRIKPIKNIFHLDNLKQKSIESFIGISRLDKYSGGDLIKIYNEYVKDPNEGKLKLLLQHNYEDIEGLLCCSSMLAYTKFKSGEIEVSKMAVHENKLVFSLKLHYYLPKRITLSTKGLTITAFQNLATITAPILSTTLKFFFENPKEYYYLPYEDMAVHKSVANFVDKNYREQAKKENCYVKKDGFFITQINTGIIQGYKYSYNSKESFIELNDSFLQNLELITAYAKHVLNLCI